MHPDPTRRAPYRQHVTAESRQETGTVAFAAGQFWLEAAAQAGDPGGRAFRVEEGEGDLVPSESCDLSVLFAPQGFQQYVAAVPLFLADSVPEARRRRDEAEGALRLLLAHVESGAADDEEVELPPVPADLGGEAYARQVVDALMDGFAPPVPFGESVVVLEMEGQGVAPQLAFDRAETTLPPVPLGCMTWSSFLIEGHGFDNLQLRWKVPTDRHPTKIPL